MRREMMAQASLTDIDGNSSWRQPAPAARKSSQTLSASVLAEIHAFEDALRRQGQVRESTVVTYGKALVCVAKQAQRHLGRDLTSVSELYENALITALVKDEVPLVETGRKLAKNTLRQRRRALRKYLTCRSSIPQ